MNLLTQPLRPAYYEDIERQLKSIFWALIYAPLVAIIQRDNAQRDEITNAPDDALKEALKSGRIQYSSGIFSGEFSAAISRSLRRLGAIFDSRTRIYRMDQGRVPGWVVAESTTYAAKAKSTHEELLRVLNEAQTYIESVNPQYQVNPEKAITAIEMGFRTAAAQLQVNPKLSPERKEELKREYTTNMEIWIKDWRAKEIVALRQRVEQNALQGYRFDRLATSINHRLSISDNHAKFLARQETSLFLAKFREKRFLDAGIRRYRWSTAHDARVRHDHAHLNGEVFSYDQPPIVDRTSGRRGNPGQDYNCRCVDIPVFDGQNR